MTIVFAILFSDSPQCALLVRYGVEWSYFYVPLHDTSYNPLPRLSRVSLWTRIQMVPVLTTNYDQCVTNLLLLTLQEIVQVACVDGNFTLGSPNPNSSREGW